MKIGSRILACSIAYLLGIASVFGAGPVDHFEVSLYPSEAKTGEALDLTIEAVDKNNSVMKDYKGTVLIFSESDLEVELPMVLEESTYTFKSSDQGKALFENAVKYNTPGKQNLYVYDLEDDSIFGVAEINISQGEVLSNTKIEILSPENGLVIGTNKIKVSGTTDKNHQVKIMVNGTGSILTMTNDSGVYEKDITTLKEGDNTIVAHVLDANGNEIGTSNTIRIRVEKNTIILTSVRAIPEEVEGESAFEVEVIATPSLREVNTIINEVITKLEEKEAGKYIAKTYAPLEQGVYKIDVILKDDLGREIKELGAGSLTVLPKLDAAEESVETPITTTEEPKPVVSKKDLKITGLKLVQLKSKSILTWDDLKDAKSYNVYKN